MAVSLELKMFTKSPTKCLNASKSSRLSYTVLIVADMHDWKNYSILR